MDSMSDEEPTGTCVCCTRRDPWRRDDGTLPLVCGPCLSQTRHMLREVPQLVDELEDRTAPEPVEVRSEVRGSLATSSFWHPPMAPDVAWMRIEQLTVASALPAGPLVGAARGDRVSGSAEPRLPVNVDALDMLAPARSHTAATAALAYPQQDEDQIGFLSVASMLDSWALDLADHRGAGENRPEPTIPMLARWLADRIEEAADDWLPFDEFFTDLRRAHGALLAQCGRIDIPDYKRGVPCSKCGHLTLLRRYGEDTVICTSCPYYMTIPEYEEYVLSMSAERKRAAAERRQVVRLLREMHAVGWRHTARRELPVAELDDPEPEEAYWCHMWTRGNERARSYVRTITHEPMGCVSLGENYGVAFFGGLIHVETDWIAANGVKKLHAFASAAGVLSVPKERP